ncbi:hypothetical protein B7O87_09310 [Cylindrospermopsis raciborskii CENA303]|uniref:UDP-2,4-diacetamido-2,4, 6-trideoxy-beta-L-altropyranose hydrolase n=1 Tax=Cylindrospermopsis raciborskii CENA303 TaxID=1170769 RepID=A0A1X4G6M0_9CYAN|nr:hypothetical protein [Cylindrospermopsis raciborskii]OSO90608.1 hypothetical protein B7O87_09310 [Cylindrospermopsis raciborskii CENA303]
MGNKWFYELFLSQQGMLAELMRPTGCLPPVVENNKQSSNLVDVKVVIRVDSSQNMGSGHLVRCRTLAEALQHRGAEVKFICRQHPGNLIHLLTHANFSVTVLPPPTSLQPTVEDYTLWLGVNLETDAAETIEALKGKMPDWLIVDHYGLDNFWEEKLRSYVGKILVIDDLANRPHNCDALLNQNYHFPQTNRYDGWRCIFAG